MVHPTVMVPAFASTHLVLQFDGHLLVFHDGSLRATPVRNRPMRSPSWHCLVMISEPFSPQTAFDRVTEVGNIRELWWCEVGPLSLLVPLTPYKEFLQTNYHWLASGVPGLDESTLRFADGKEVIYNCIQYSQIHIPSDSEG